MSILQRPNGSLIANPPPPNLGEVLSFIALCCAVVLMLLGTWKLGDLIAMGVAP